MLGRESIIITLEDVFVCASQRDDQEVISMFLLKKRLFLTIWGKIEALMLHVVPCFLLASKFQNKVKKKNLMEDVNLFIYFYGASYFYF